MWRGSRFAAVSRVGQTDPRRLTDVQSMIRLAVTSLANDWIVTQDGDVISRLSTKSEAISLACLVAVASKAAGGRAELIVAHDAGRTEDWNLERPFP